MSISLMMMQPILSTCLFTSITDVTVDNNTDFGSTFLVNDDGTDDDNNINTIQLMISSPMIATSLYIFDVSDDNDTVLTATPRFLVHARVQVTFQVQNQVPVQVLFQKTFQVTPKVLFQAVHFLIQVLIHQVLFPFLIRVFLLLFN